MQRKPKNSRNISLIMHLFKRQYIWMPTALGWGIIIILVASLLAFLFTNTHPFFAVNSPIPSQVLVVEGWIPDYAVEEALVKFKEKSYSQIITTGIPLEKGSYLSEYNNYAEVSAATLKKLGLESEKIVVVPSQEVKKDRTYASAIALRQWLKNSDIKITSINLFTHDTHARRSWLIFQKALAPNIQVGVIASSPQSYNPKKWWAYSTGVRSIIDETVAYVYALIVSWQA